MQSLYAFSFVTFAGLCRNGRLTNGLCMDYIDYYKVLEKYIHLHYDLDINLEGLDAVAHLLNQIQVLQVEVRQLRNELGR